MAGGGGGGEWRLAMRQNHTVSLLRHHPGWKSENDMPWLLSSSIYYIGGDIFVAKIILLSSSATKI